MGDAWEIVPMAAGSAFLLPNGRHPRPATA